MSIALLAQTDAELPSTTRAFLDALKASGFVGEISTDYGTRTVLSTDSHVFQGGYDFN